MSIICGIVILFITILLDHYTLNQLYKIRKGDCWALSDIAFFISLQESSPVWSIINGYIKVKFSPFFIALKITTVKDVFGAFFY